MEVADRTRRTPGAHTTRYNSVSEPCIVRYDEVNDWARGRGARRAAGRRRLALEVVRRARSPTRCSRTAGARSRSGGFTCSSASAPAAWAWCGRAWIPSSIAGSRSSWCTPTTPRPRATRIAARGPGAREAVASQRRAGLRRRRSSTSGVFLVMEWVQGQDAARVLHGADAAARDRRARIARRARARRRARAPGSCTATSSPTT